MKNFSKTLISMAAVMAVGSAMAVSAMANELSFNTDALTSAGTITIDNVTPNKSQYTLLVVQGTKADGAETYTYDANSSTIKQVDQNDAGTAFSTIVLGTKQADDTYKLDDGSYKVLVGNNDGSLDSGIFTVSSTPQVVTKDILVGDTDVNGKINIQDTLWMRRYSAKQTTNIGKVGTALTKADGTGNYLVGDTDVNGKINIQDTLWMRRYSAKQTTNIGKVGSTVTVIVE